MKRVLSIMTIFSWSLLLTVGCSSDSKDKTTDGSMKMEAGAQSEAGPGTDGSATDASGTHDSGTMADNGTNTNQDSGGGTSDWQKFFTDHAGTYKGKATLLQKAGSDYVDQNTEYQVKLEANGKVTFLSTKKGDISTTYDNADGDTFQIIAKTTTVAIRNPASAESLVVSLAYTIDLGMTISISILDATKSVPTVVAGWSLGLVTKQ